MFIPAKKTTTFQFDSTRAPHVFIAREALSKMQIYVETVNDEVGWLGTAVLNETDAGREIVIEDTFLIKQEVHGTTTELTPEGLTEFAMELLSQEGGTEIYNKMRMWGHSHVNMGTSPSGQDDKQMKEFANIGHDWFVRLIANKKGDIRVDFYEYSTGITMLNLNWEAEELQDDAVALALEDNIAQLYEQIANLEDALDDKRKEHVLALEPSVKEQIKEKVKKKTYAYAGYKAPQGTHGRPPTTYPSVGKHNPMPSAWDDYLYQQEWQFNPSTSHGGGASDPFDTDYTGTDDLQGGAFLHEDYETEEYQYKYELARYFTDEDCINLSALRDEQQLGKFFEDHGYRGTFTLGEAISLWELAVAHYSKYKGAQ